MCGILAQISAHAPPAPEPESFLKDITNRGPDNVKSHEASYTSPDSTGTQHHVRLTSTVLSLRGDHITPQPLVCASTGSALCWNGEAWRIAGVELGRGVNDGEEVFRLLLDAAAVSDDGGRAVVKALQLIEGPFAFVFFDKVGGRVWFGRDCLGRRSLVWCMEGETGAASLLVASVSDGRKERGWKEVLADGVYYLDLKRRKVVEDDGSNGAVLVPFLPQEPVNGAADRAEKSEDLVMRLPYPPLNAAIPSPVSASAPLTAENSKYPGQLREVLLEAVRLRVQNIYTPGTAPSGSKVALLFSGGLDCTVLARLAHEVLPVGETIDLLNVAFENPRVVAAHVKGPTPGKAKNKSKNFRKKSEGQDVPLDPYSLCPDRMTSITSLKDLKDTCPGRTFNLVHINIPYTLLLEHRAKVISLIYPHSTEMDLSIALAFYFASRGVGVLYPTLEPYTTPSRILLSGLGADELFAGYARHGTAFARGGWEAIVRELELEVGRIGKRNLGRDDRVLACWGKEGRYPFLDERVVAWAMRTPVEGKCSFGCEGGEDEQGKRVLRVVAEMLGMALVSREKKRAVQFGARTAKMGGGGGVDDANGTGEMRARRKIKGTQQLEE
ncbi:asparagine synthase-domain-containing protein [Peziza echinospora]|nr:asparagine synthase-domain-containing protein [Peziza echinospora]